MSMISVKGLRKNFGKHEVLKGIDIEIQPGEVVAIVGPSGCGKSTFLRCLNLLEQPTKGTITFDGDVEADCGVCIFHAGTKLGTPDSSEFVTSGGRVLGITAVRDTLEEAVRAAYAAAERVHFDGKYSRSDIGLSALRESRLKNG